MNILIITDVLLRNDNGVGNSYSNIFGGIKNIKIANICCQEGVSQNNISSACFQMSEVRLLKNLINSSIASGITEMITGNGDIIQTQQSKKVFDKITKSRLQMFFWIRNLIWKVGRWKSKELNGFIDEFKPDIIFAQLQDKMYLNNIVMYVQEYTKKPLFVYAWDDVYSLKQFSLSPLYWIDRLFQRKSIRRLIKRCNILYTISEEQRKEYEEQLHKRTKLLYKGYSFDNKPNSDEVNEPLRMLYTGNLYSGRYKTIVKLCRCLQEINKEKTKIVVDIYSGTKLNEKEKGKLNIIGTSSFKGKISENEVQKLQTKADILLHVEPFTLKGSLLCRLSFSTKLVDYFNKGKCIFSVGSERCSSMKYLQRYDAAITSFNYNDMRANITALVSDQNKIREYAEKAWRCGRNNHKINIIQRNLLRDLEEAINEGSTN